MRASRHAVTVSCTSRTAYCSKRKLKSQKRYRVTTGLLCCFNFAPCNAFDFATCVARLSDGDFVAIMKTTDATVLDEQKLHDPRADAVIEPAVESRPRRTTGVKEAKIYIDGKF